VFRFADLAADSCLITTDLQGFVAETAQAVVHRDEVVSVALHLVTVPIRVGVAVDRAAARLAAPMPSARKTCTNTCGR
jgi:hypothetical protein